MRQSEIDAGVARRAAAAIDGPRMAIGRINIGSASGTLYAFRQEMIVRVPAVADNRFPAFRYYVAAEFGREEIRGLRRLAAANADGIAAPSRLVLSLDGPPPSYCPGARVVSVMVTGKLGGLADADVVLVGAPFLAVPKSNWRRRLAAWFRR